MNNFKDNDHVALVRDIEYEIVDGLCDTVHAAYTIPTVNTAEKRIEIAMYRCATGSTGRCDDNREYFAENLSCDRFKEDHTGPWYMISDGMSGSHCGEEKGDFKLENARLKPSYISKYMIEDVEHARHRMELLIVKKGKTENEDLVRACLNLEFVILF